MFFGWAYMYYLNDVKPLTFVRIYYLKAIKCVFLHCFTINLLRLRVHTDLFARYKFLFHPQNWWCLLLLVNTEWHFLEVHEHLTLSQIRTRIHMRACACVMSVFGDNYCWSVVTYLILILHFLFISLDDKNLEYLRKTPAQNHLRKKCCKAVRDDVSCHRNG